MAQVQALIPYLDHLEDHTIYTFYALCNDRGWFDLGRKFFDGRLSGKNQRLDLEDQFFASLDEIVRDKMCYWTIDRLVDNYQKSGVTPGEVIDVIGKWLAAQKTFEALQLAAMVVIYIGRPKDLHILNAAIEPNEAAKALVVDTAFAVRRRSLG